MFNKKNIEENVAAVLWDFDGTIMDTMHKHFLVNREMFSLLKPNVKKENYPDVISSLEKYIKAEYDSINWRDCYKKHFGFSEKQIDYAGSLWGALALKNKTPIKLFDGIKEVFEKIKVPHGICSQNCSKNIKNILQNHAIDHHFTSIIGHRDIEKQKPDPEGFVLSLENMKIKNGVLFYIGDHKEDVIFAKNAQKVLNKKGLDFKIFSIVASYSGANSKLWNIKPDFEASKPEDISKIILEKRMFSKV